MQFLVMEAVVKILMILDPYIGQGINNIDLLKHILSREESDH